MNLLMSKMIFLRIPFIHIIPIIIYLLFFVFQIILLVKLVKSQKKGCNARKKTKKLIKISIYLLILHEIYLVVSGLINYELRYYPKESLYFLNLLISLLIISMEKKGKGRYIFKLVTSIIFLLMSFVGIEIFLWLWRRLA